MSTICPHCRHVRQPLAKVPEWQCPSCGVAYYKAPKSAAYTLPWGKLLIIAGLVYGLWTGSQMAQNNGYAIPGLNNLTVTKSVTNTENPQNINELAKTVRAGEIVIYGTDGCPTCAEAKSWLTQNGFQFSYCNLEISKHCQRKFSDLGGKYIPMIVVRGHALSSGFDAPELLSTLRKY